MAQESQPSNGHDGRRVEDDAKAIVEFAQNAHDYIAQYVTSEYVSRAFCRSFPDHTIDPIKTAFDFTYVRPPEYGPYGVLLIDHPAFNNGDQVIIKTTTPRATMSNDCGQTVEMELCEVGWLVTGPDGTQSIDNISDACELAGKLAIQHRDDCNDPRSLLERTMHKIRNRHYRTRLHNLLQKTRY